MKLVRFDAIGKDGKPYRLSVDSVSIASVEENTAPENTKTCIFTRTKR